MDKDSAVEIRRTANGYMVSRAHNPFGDNEVRASREVFVFIDKGKNNTPNEDTLLGWLDAHFT